MSNEDLKYEITKVLESFSEGALKELLAFLKELEQKNQDVLEQQSLSKKILSEDKDLLQKLAQ